MNSVTMIDDFFSLKLQPDQKLQFIDSEKNTHICRFVGAIAGQTVIVSPEEAELEFDEEKSVTLRILMPEGITEIVTAILHVSEIPMKMIYLHFPKAIQIKKVRSEPRVRTAMPVLINETDTGKTCEGRLVDVSYSGMSILCDKDACRVGRKITIKAKFAKDNVISLDGQILSSDIVKEKYERYGIQITTEEDSNLGLYTRFVASNLADKELVLVNS